VRRDRGSVVEWLDRSRVVTTYWAVDATHAPARRRLELVDLGGRLHFAPTHSAYYDDPSADASRSIVAVHPYDALLPQGQVRRIRDIRKDVLWSSGDLDARNDGWHRPDSLVGNVRGMMTHTQTGGFARDWRTLCATRRQRRRRRASQVRGKDRFATSTRASLAASQRLGATALGQWLIARGDRSAERLERPSLHPHAYAREAYEGSPPHSR